MRSNILVSLGLVGLLFLNACSPAMLNKFGKSSLFTKSILVRPSVITAVPTNLPVEEQSVLKAVQTSPVLKYTDTPSPASNATTTPPEKSTLPEPSPTAPTIQATEQSSPASAAETTSPSPTPMTPTVLMAEQPTTATPVNTMTPAIVTFVTPPTLLSGLANLLNVDPGKLVISDLVPVSWPDLCFDFLRGNSTACNQITTPGYQGRVLINQKAFGGNPQYTFRSDAAGKLIYTLPVAALAARDVLSAAKGVSPDAIHFILVEKWDWPNTCAMTPAPLPKDALCIAVPLPGWRVVLGANASIYEYHTDLNGQVVQSSMP